MIDARPDQTESIKGRPARQSFTLFDAMVLIAATGVGLTFALYSQMKYFSWEKPSAPDKLIYYTLIQIGKPVSGTLPILYGLCVAVVAKGLWGARPRREEFTRRPGLAACTAALVELLAVLSAKLLAYAVGHPGVLWSKQPFDVLFATTYASFWSPDAIDSIFKEAGVHSISAILAVWALQRLSGLWHAVPEWPDRLGRAIGLVLLLWALTPH